jgi:hypothetical protein
VKIPTSLPSGRWPKDSLVRDSLGLFDVLWVVLAKGAFLLHEQKTITTRGTRRRKYRIESKKYLSCVTDKVKVFGKALLHTQSGS